jgi:ATP-dependent helicase/nuclease subunit A
MLVDEFQDTDPLQVELVKALCGDELSRGKLFFVGDYKQSIYRFRRADPRVFRQLQEEVPHEGRLPLTLNFRSQPQILAFVNALFCEELGSQSNGPAYEPLRASRPQVAEPPVVEFLWAPAEEPEEATASLRRREAQWIARRLRELLDTPARVVLDRHAAASLRDGSVSLGETRPREVRPGDIAVLFRALSDVQFYEEALRQHGIDYYLVGGHAFYAQQEIFDLLNLLRAIAYPSDLVSLVGVLRSPFFALTDETLYWLARHSEGIGAGLFAPPPQVDDQQRPRVELAAATLLRLRACKDRLPITALVDDALRTTGYDAILLAEFMGERKLANLRKLIDQARTFDRSGIFTLCDFIRQLSEFVAKQPDEPLAATMPESAGVVRLMTIHQAKGLEFPVVVLPDLRRPTNYVLPPAAFHAELGPLVRPLEEDRKQHVVTGYDFLRRIEAGEDESELMRLFYVATTRAADYLILSSGVSELGEAESPWLRLLAKRFDLHTGACLASLPRGFERPQVRVTTSEPTVDARSRQRRRPNLEAVIAQAEALSANGQIAPPPSIQAIPVDVAARREFSFSRLNGTLHETLPRENLVASPELGDDALADRARPFIDPLGLGTLVHAVLEELPFNGQQASRADIEALVARYAPDHVPGDAAAATEAVALVHRFAQSPFMAELAGAQEVYRELEFLLAWPPERPTTGGTYLRGYVDCLFRDARGRWRVLDYKTNAVTAENVRQAAAPYEMQMLVYALAVEAGLGQTPEAMVLYFLQPGVAHTLKLDAEARRRAVSLVNRAIAGYLGQSLPEAEDTLRPDGRRADGPWPPPRHARKKQQGLLPGFFESKAE